MRFPAGSHRFSPSPSGIAAAACSNPPSKLRPRLYRALNSFSYLGSTGRGVPTRNVTSAVQWPLHGKKEFDPTPAVVRFTRVLAVEAPAEGVRRLRVASIRLTRL